MKFYDLEEVNRQASGRWKDILVGLGILSSHQVSGKDQPCPMCGGTDRFKYTDFEREGLYYCRGCGPSNSWKLVQEIKHIDFPAALRLVGDYLMVEEKNPNKKPTKPVEPLLEAIPAPKPIEYEPGTYIKLWNNKGTQQNNNNYEMFWPWYGLDGKIAGYIGRTQAKVTHQIFWTSKGWTQGSLGKGRPLFGLQTLPGKKKVIVVEGEKVWHWVNQEMKDYAVITWTGGAQTVNHSDWSPLFGKEVYIFPDNDSQGGKAAQEIASILVSKSTVFIVPVPEGKPDAWDLADGLEEEMMMASDIEEMIVDAKAEEPIQADIKLDLTDESKKFLYTQIKPLGFDDGRIFVMPGQQLQVRDLSMSDLSKGVLRGIAPLDVWGQYFQGDNGAATNWDRAGDWLLRACEGKGPYSPSLIRGRGVWRDEDRIVVHLGNKLVVDGVETKLVEFQSNYIYSAQQKLADWGTTELSQADADYITDVVYSIRWKNPLYAELFLGFIALGPICGALKWRPHIWTTGPAGIGKSTILRDVLCFLLGSFHLAVEGGTTEAGIRQKLKADALPVCFDEPEGNNAHDISIIEKISKLARSSSTESNSEVLKGTAGGKSNAYHIRSCFAFFSINASLKDKADRDRTTILELKPKDDNSQAEWPLLKKKINGLKKTMANELFVRQINDIDLNLENIDAFSTVLGDDCGFQRAGDQYGTLLGAAYTFRTRRKITKEQAMAEINKYTWDQMEENLEDTRELEAMEIFRNSMVRVSRESLGGVDMSIGELVRIINTRDNDNHYVKLPEARRTLELYGIKVKEGFNLVYIINKNVNLTQILKNYVWLANWAAILSRLEGAEKCPNPMWLGSHLGKQRCMLLPTHYFYGDDDGKNS